MIYKETLKIGKSETDKINKALKWKKGCPDEERMEQDDIISHTVEFKNGYQADFKVVGTDFEELSEEDEAMFPYHNAAWTEMALFTRDGAEVAASEIDEEYFGVWEFEYNDDIYEVTIEVDE